MVNTEPSAAGQNATAYHPVMFTSKPLAFAFRGAALALALTACIGAYASTIVGRVVGVADGDTVTVLDSERVQHKVRLAGIDAPERSQAFGNRSKESLSELVFSKTVTVETDKLDRYGRAVGKVLVGGRDVNLIQVERGFGWHYKAYESEQSENDRLLYDAAEREARAARRGLWQDLNPVAPWDFRKARREAGASQ
jgi:endonuclease YncB( thermonuclease family)